MECSFEELDALGAALDLELSQFPLRIPHFGRSLADRERQFAAANASLGARGLVSGTRFDPLLERSLRVLAARTHVIAALGDSLVAVAAFDSETGVVAVQQDESLRLVPVDPDAAAAELVALLPELPPGPGSPVTVPDDLARRRFEEEFSEQRFTSAVRTKSVPVSAEAMLRRPRLGGGSFLVTARSKELGSVSWLDNDQGRYAILRGTGHSVWLPASRTVITSHLNQILHTS